MTALLDTCGGVGQGMRACGGVASGGDGGFMAIETVRELVTRLTVPTRSLVALGLALDEAIRNEPLAPAIRTEIDHFLAALGGGEMHVRRRSRISVARKPCAEKPMPSDQALPAINPLCLSRALWTWAINAFTRAV